MENEELYPEDKAEAMCDICLGDGVHDEDCPIFMEEQSEVEGNNQQQEVATR